MKEVIFPTINLKLELNSIAISIFGIDIYWYAIFIVSAIIIAIFLLKRDNGKYNIKFNDVLELIVIVLPISIICARLYYVIFKIEYYSQKPLEIFSIRNGGLAIYGGIMGAIITIFIYCKIRKINVLDMLDYIVPYLPLGQAIGRWGNLFNVEAYGVETTNLFRMGIWENERYIEVHPTFLYESIVCLAIFILLYRLRNKRKYIGEITYMYLALYGLGRGIIEGVRADSLMLGNFKVSQVISIILCTIFGVILVYKQIKTKKEEQSKRSY